MKPRTFTVHFYNENDRRKEFWEVCVYHSPVTNVVELTIQHNSGDFLDMPLTALMDIAHTANIIAHANFTPSQEKSHE
jgi:hypothetical protein